MQERWITDRVPSKVFTAYTRGNAGEVLPDPVSPLAWSFMWGPGIVKGCRDGFIEFGLVDWDEFETPDDPECFGMYGGYFYNPLSLVRLMGARIPGGSPEAIDAAYFDPRPDVPPYVREAWHESEKHATKLGGSFGWVMTTPAHDQIDADHEMAEKIRAAVDTRSDRNFQIVARTDAIAVEGFAAALDRAHAFIEAGADVTFVEAPLDADQLTRIARELSVPQIVNIVHGGKTPALPRAEFARMGFRRLSMQMPRCRARCTP